METTTTGLQVDMTVLAVQLTEFRPMTHVHDSAPPRTEIRREM